MSTEKLAHMRHLVYVTDPMCSWCYGFSEALAEATRARDFRVELVLGGLAPDSNERMPESMARYIQSAWEAVAERTGAEFNHQYWKVCTPRRSTYPACRAVIAAGYVAAREAEKGEAGASPPSDPPRLWMDEPPGAMFRAIQRAYYQEARNPSDEDTLIACAESIGLDAQAFAAQLRHPDTEIALQKHFARRDAMAANGYPSMAWWVKGATRDVMFASGCMTAADLIAAIDATT